MRHLEAHACNDPQDGLQLVARNALLLQEVLHCTCALAGALTAKSCTMHTARTHVHTWTTGAALLPQYFQSATSCRSAACSTSSKEPACACFLCSLYLNHDMTSL